MARPGTYPLHAGETLSSLVLAAGGLADNAWLPGAALLRPSEKARQSEELAAIARRLEAAILPGGSATEETAKSSSFLASLRNLVPAGRVPVRLSHPRLMINAPEDLPLREGDLLYIPAPPHTVRILGAVRTPGEVPASPGARLPALAASAGGYLPDADVDGALLLRADGTARPLREGWIVWNDAAGRWEFSAFRKDRPRIGPGDTVFVPRKPGGIPWPGGIDDYRRTMARILEITGAGAAW